MDTATSARSTMRTPIAAERSSHMAETLIGSEILKIASDIRALTAAGASICNLTVGDFDPKQFPIPEVLREAVETAYHKGETNYPPSSGMLQLREAIVGFYRSEMKQEFPLSSILVTGGARPGIYAAYQTVVDPGDKVIYPVPSWNNNHYCHLSRCIGVPVSCGPDTNFLPTAALLAPHIRDARMIALCSPLNPAGTLFDAQTLGDICDMILAENKRRTSERPLYLLYDQVYWMLTFNGRKHVDPVSLRPEMANYTIYIDGISKAFAATGVRVGWVVAPPDVAQTMSNVLGHIGAWAPRPEQIATAALLTDSGAIQDFRASMESKLTERLMALYNGFQDMERKGLPVRAIAPMGAIYLTVQIEPAALGLSTNDAVRTLLLREANTAIVPFQAFGAKEETGWFRLSVGAVSMEEINAALPRIEQALQNAKVGQ